MTYRERKEANLAKRERWAESRRVQSASAFKRANTIAQAIPFGQPILVGHHSEKHHRADLARIDSAMRNGVESQNMAARHVSVAAEIERQLDRSIYDDDADAIEKLEARIAALTAQRERMVAVNRAYRSKDPAGNLSALGLDYDQIKARLAAAGPYWGSAPHLPYEMSNLGGRISADRKRLEVIKTRNQRSAQAEASSNGVMVTYHKGYSCASGAFVESNTFYACLTFAEKPSREVLDSLKAAGYHWGKGTWTGETAKMPEIVRVLLGTNP
jgi:hypothetical protein